jgi:hypothetical protein
MVFPLADELLKKNGIPQHTEIGLDILQEVCCLPFYGQHITVEVLKGDFSHCLHIGANAMDTDEAERENGETCKRNKELAADGEPGEYCVEV